MNSCLRTHQARWFLPKVSVTFPMQTWTSPRGVRNLSRQHTSEPELVQTIDFSIVEEDDEEKYSKIEPEADDDLPINEQCQTDQKAEEEKCSSANCQLENTILRLEQNKVDIGDWNGRELVSIPPDVIPHVIQAHPQMSVDVAFPNVASKQKYETKNRKKRRRLNLQSFKTYEWLVYSKRKQGALCRFCALGFTRTKNFQKLDQPVTVPSRNMEEIVQILKDHNKTIHHTGAFI